MGIEQIQKIHEFGEINVIISLLLCAMLVIALKAGWEKLLDVLGLETKASLQKKALEKKLSDMEQKIAFQYISCYSLSFWQNQNSMQLGEVSIHLMLLFITGEDLRDYIGGKFQYISCYSLSYLWQNRAALDHVSIHLMLLFIIYTKI